MYEIYFLCDKSYKYFNGAELRGYIVQFSGTGNLYQWAL